MTDSWQALREIDRDLALCLLFCPADRRAVLADRLSLALEAESALRIASEPMLAAIRLQWWVDAIELHRHENVPLIGRLLTHLEAGHLRQDEVLAQLAIWQDRLSDDTCTPATCWRDLFAMLADSGDMKATAGLVGAVLLDKATAGHLDHSYLDDGHLAGLRTRHLYWIWMAAQVARHRMAGKYREDDALLVWRMLGWRLGITRPSPSPSP
jgi:hypothetical protein